MASDDSDLDFAALMRAQGVAPTRPARPACPTGARTSERAPAKRAPEARPAAAAAPAAPAASSTTRGPSAAPAAGPASARADEREALRARCEALTRRCAELTAERDSLIAGRDATAAERDRLVARVATLERDHDAAQQVAVAAAKAVARAEASAQRQVAAPEPARISLAAALVARGVHGGAEQGLALALLAASESAPALLEALETRDLAGLRSALDRRLALVCGAPGCEPQVGAAALRVAPARCEVCGGSDIQRAARGFVAACTRAAVQRVRFVGGSPNYRTKLAALFPAGGALTVLTTAGDRRVPLHRSRAQQRSDDLVIIWGATELDHATSGAYRAQHGRVEIIAHRGIGRMLELAAQRLAPA